MTVPLGLGIYTRAEAARLLGMTPGRVGRWVAGYTYWLREGRQRPDRRKQPPVIRTELPQLGTVLALSFLELMELRVVKALTDKGLSLQHVRAAARIAGKEFDTRHPFASRRVFTDGTSIFSAVDDHPSAPNVVKWRKGEIVQVVAGPIFAQFLSEIEFDSATALARRWWPCGRKYPVLLDPAIAFGAPVAEKTGIRTTTIARYCRHTNASETAEAFELPKRVVEAALHFEERLAAA
ncbi:MAG TPA: hypothetical protein VG940_08710 [Gemmatimonadales bacterium]|nr:hypothetical protein [Gemmatimonadales bacterium]